VIDSKSHLESRNLSLRSNAWFTIAIHAYHGVRNVEGQLGRSGSALSEAKRRAHVNLIFLDAFW